MAEHHTVAVRVVGSKPIIRPKKTWKYRVFFYLSPLAFCTRIL